MRTHAPTHNACYCLSFYTNYIHKLKSFPSPPIPPFGQVISPTSEHLFQALSSQDQEAWVHTLQSCTAQAIKRSSGRPELSAVRLRGGGSEETQGEVVPDAMNLILDIPGNRTCADCSSSGILFHFLMHTLTHLFFLSIFLSISLSSTHSPVPSLSPSLPCLSLPHASCGVGQC